MTDTPDGGMAPSPRTPAEIRADLDAIAPMPAGAEASATDLARHFAVRAAERNAGALSVIRPMPDGQQVSLICAEFTAALALAALADPLTPPLWGAAGFGAMSPAELSRKAATQIRNALEDGSSIGEWLWEFLGEETCSRILALSDELTAAVAAQETGVAGKAAGQ